MRGVTPQTGAGPLATAGQPAAQPETQRLEPDAKLEPEQPLLSLDWWSVLIALAAVLAVESGLGHSLPW